jgi:hypothetical protein
MVDSYEAFGVEYRDNFQVARDDAERMRDPVNQCNIRLTQERLARLDQGYRYLIPPWARSSWDRDYGRPFVRGPDGRYHFVMDEDGNIHRTGDMDARQAPQTLGFTPHGSEVRYNPPKLEDHFYLVGKVALRNLRPDELEVYEINPDQHLVVCGCQRGSPEWWKENLEKVLKNMGYSGQRLKIAQSYFWRAVDLIIDSASEDMNNAREEEFFD